MNRLTALYVAGSWSEARELIGRWQDEPDNNATEVLHAISKWLAHASSLERPSPDLHGTAAKGGNTVFRMGAWSWSQRIGAARDSSDHAALARASAGAFAAAVEAFDLADDFPIVWPHIVAASLEAGALDQAAAQIDHVAAADPGLVPALLRAQQHRFQGLLAAARGEDPEAELRAGIEALDAFGAKPDAARTRQALAEWLSAQGREKEAAELLAAALAVYEELGAAGWIGEVSGLPIALASGGG